MPCLNPFCKCHRIKKEQQEQERDKLVDDMRAFIRARSRAARGFWCSVCRMHPPKHWGGPCDNCEQELGAGG